MGIMGIKLTKMFEACDRDMLRGYARRVVAGELTIMVQVPSEPIECEQVVLRDHNDNEFADEHWQGHIWTWSEDGIKRVSPTDEKDYSFSEFAYPIKVVKQYLDEHGAWLKSGFYELCDAQEIARKILSFPYADLRGYNMGVEVDEVYIKAQRMRLHRMRIIESCESRFATLELNRWFSSECAFTPAAHHSPAMKSGN